MGQEAKGRVLKVSSEIGEEHRDATRKEAIEHALACRSVAGRLQAEDRTRKL